MVHTRGCLAWAAITLSVASGCLTNTYRIPQNELARLATMPPGERGARVRVQQEWFRDTAPPAAAPVNVYISTGYTVYTPPANRPGPSGLRPSVSTPAGEASPGSPAPSPVKPDGGGPLKGGNAAGDAKDAAVAVIVLAVAGIAIGAATAGARFDGEATTHPMHPVHIYTHSGGYQVMPLAWIDPRTAAMAHRAVLAETEGPFRRLDRAPLDRRGLTYSVMGGASTSVSADGRLGVGPMWHLQGGYFFNRQLGVLVDVALSWRTNRLDATLFDNRFSLELQALPLAAGRVHAGGFASFGVGGRFEDALPGGDDAGALFSGGVLLQLDWTTHLAVTGRVGVASAFGELTREGVVGLSIY